MHIGSVKRCWRRGVRVEVGQEVNRSAAVGLVSFSFQLSYEVRPKLLANNIMDIR
jgi:hypothetical protein